MSGNASNYLADFNNLLRGKVRWVPWKSTDGAAHVRVVNASCPAEFNDQIYAGTAVGSTIRDSGLSAFSYWQFQVDGVDADDDISISISLDGLNYYKPGLVDVMTGALIDQTAANIEADGVYRFGTVAEQDPIVMTVVGFKVTRETAAGSNAVTVQATGR